MFKILMLSKITIVLTIFVNNTGNLHVNTSSFFLFFFEKAIHTAVKIEQVMDSLSFFKK